MPPWSQVQPHPRKATSIFSPGPGLSWGDHGRCTLVLPSTRSNPGLSRPHWQPAWPQRPSSPRAGSGLWPPIGPGFCWCRRAWGCCSGLHWCFLPRPGPWAWRLPVPVPAQSPHSCGATWPLWECVSPPQRGPRHKKVEASGSPRGAQRAEGWACVVPVWLGRVRVSRLRGWRRRRHLR